MVEYTLPKDRTQIENDIFLYNHFLKNVFPEFRATSSVIRYMRDIAHNENPITNCGKKVYSQNDEDGITFEILRRIGLKTGVFGEFGVGKGTENNTLALIAAGWKGFWVGGEDLEIDINPLKVNKLNFYYQKEWIKKHNIVKFYKNCLNKIRQDVCDLISLDLDGNDYYFVNELLSSNVLPKVFIVEYNGKFIPPIKFTIDYDDNFKWETKSDYYGASLAKFVELFENFGYFLVCCNITGLNAFFVKNEYRQHFQDVSIEISELFVTPKYFLSGFDTNGHTTTIKTINHIISKCNNGN